MSKSRQEHATQLKASDRKFAEVLTRTNTDDPDPEDLRRLRKALRETPGLCQRIIDLTRVTEDQIVESVASENALLTESLRQRLKEMKADLQGDGAPALEKLLIDQVTLTWLHFYETQRRYANVTSGQYRITEAEHWEKRVNAAQRRYLRAVKTLARVRKMAGREPLQINIAKKQVNVAG